MLIWHKTKQMQETPQGLLGHNGPPQQTELGGLKVCVWGGEGSNSWQGIFTSFRNEEKSLSQKTSQ